jgi:uncharacterized transporter YbjL
LKIPDNSRLRANPAHRCQLSAVVIIIIIVVVVVVIIITLIIIILPCLSMMSTVAGMYTPSLTSTPALTTRKSSSGQPAMVWYLLLQKQHYKIIPTHKV